MKEKIQHGNLQVGDYLPSENELCADFSITRTTVRKALDNLLKVWLHRKTTWKRLPGKVVKASWFYPRTGETTAIGEFENSGEKSF